MVIIYTVSAISGFALSSFAGAYLPDLIILRGSQFTVGASASIFGLLGALVYYGHRSGSRTVGSQAFSYALMMGLFGFIMPGVDNYAHLGGFIGGICRTADFCTPSAWTTSSSPSCLGLRCCRSFVSR
jgi:rhomboid protease GluP